MGNDVVLGSVWGDVCDWAVIDGGHVMMTKQGLLGWLSAIGVVGDGYGRGGTSGGQCRQSVVAGGSDQFGSGSSSCGTGYHIYPTGGGGNYGGQS
jgi:hypothetical protein